MKLKKMLSLVLFLVVTLLVSPQSTYACGSKSPGPKHEVSPLLQKFEGKSESFLRLVNEAAEEPYKFELAFEAGSDVYWAHFDLVDPDSEQLGFVASLLADIETPGLDPSDPFDGVSLWMNYFDAILDKLSSPKTDCEVTLKNAVTNCKEAFVKFVGVVLQQYS